MAPTTITGWVSDRFRSVHDVQEVIIYTRSLDVYK